MSERPIPTDPDADMVMEALGRADVVWLAQPGDIESFVAETCDGAEAHAVRFGGAGCPVCSSSGACEPVPVVGKQGVWRWDGTVRP